METKRIQLGYGCAGSLPDAGPGSGQQLTLWRSFRKAAKQTALSGIARRDSFRIDRFFYLEECMRRGRSH